MAETVREEIARGLHEIDDFLMAITAFDEWCRLNPEQAPIAIAAIEQLRRLRASGADAA